MADFVKYEQLPDNIKSEFVAQLSPEQKRRFEADYNNYRLNKGAENAIKVNSSKESAPSAGSIGKEAGQAVVTEGLKEAGSALFSNGASQAALTTPTSLSTGGQVGNFLAGNSLNGVASTTGANGQAATMLADGSVVNSVPGAGIGSYIGPAAGIATAGYNVYDAGKNILKGSRGGKGTVEGVGTIAGTALGSLFGPVGAGIGSVIGRTAGRGLASIGDKFGWVGRKSTADMAAERFRNALKGAATEADADWMTRTFEQANKNRKENPDAIFGPESELAGRQYKWDEVKRVASGKDIWGESMWQQLPDWMSGYSEAERERIAQAALDHDLITPDRGGLVFSEKHGDLAKIRDIANQIKQNTYVDIKTPEQRAEEERAFKESIGVDPNSKNAYETAPTQQQNQSQQPSTRKEAIVEEILGPQRKRRPAPKLNDIPVPQAPVPTVTIRTPKDYAQAYLDVYKANSDISGGIINPYLRRY